MTSRPRDLDGSLLQLMDAFTVGAAVGPYVLEHLLGRGGMGAVFRARHRGTGQVRALKVMLPSHAAATPDAVARFVRETSLAVSVEHPNVARVFDAFEHEGAWVLPMEFVEGVSLERHLTPTRGARRALPLEEAIPLLRALCDGVDAIHARGIIHRDLTPANVMLATLPVGVATPKIVDFGAARLTDDRDELTGAGLAFGTPAYMPPEQMEGRRDLDARVDVYALGVIAYQMLTARRPYEDDEAGIIPAKVIRRLPFARPTEHAPGLPAAIEAAVLGALALDRDQRTLSARAFSDALALACTPDGSSTRVGIETTAGAPSALRRRHVGPIAVAVSLVVGGAIFALRPSPRSFTASAAQRAFTAPAASPTLPPSPRPVEPIEQSLHAPAPLVPGGTNPSVAPTPTPPPNVDTPHAPHPAPPRHRPRRRRCRARPGIVCPPEGL